MSPRVARAILFALPSVDSTGEVPIRSRRFNLLVRTSVSAIAVLLFPCYLYGRATTIESFASPDGRWRLVVRDVDPNPYQVTATFTVTHAMTTRALPGEPFRMYCDSVEPIIGPVTWSHDEVRIDKLRLVCRFGAGGQSWTRNWFP